MKNNWSEKVKNSIKKHQNKTNKQIIINKKKRREGERQTHTEVWRRRLQAVTMEKNGQHVAGTVPSPPPPPTPPTPTPSHPPSNQGS